MKTTLTFLLLTTAAASAAWYLSYSNSQDGWTGPTAATEISEDGSMAVRTVPLAYQAFNTNRTPVYDAATTNYKTFTAKVVFEAINIATYTRPCFPTNIIFRTNTAFKTNELAVQSSDGVEVVFVCRDQDRTNIVNSLAASGEICRVRGHTFVEHADHGLVAYLPGTFPCRKCTTCGKHETLFLEWK